MYKYNLKVYVYIFRNEDRYLVWNYSKDFFNEYEIFFNILVDGYFLDFLVILKKFLDMEYFILVVIFLFCFVSDVFGLYRSGIFLFFFVFIVV